MVEITRILQKSREFAESVACTWEEKSALLYKHAQEIESCCNSKLQKLLHSMKETGNALFACH